MTVAKFRISSYFAKMTSIVSCFRKYHSKILIMKRFSFLQIEESPKMAILPACRRRKWPKIVHFLFLVQINAMISINILWVAHSAYLKQQDRKPQMLLRQSHYAFQISSLQSFQTSLPLKIPRLRRSVSQSE